MTLDEFLKQYVKGLHFKNCMFFIDSEDYFRWDYRKDASQEIAAKVHIAWVLPNTNLPTVLFNDLEYMVDVSGSHLKLILI